MADAFMDARNKTNGAISFGSIILPIGNSEVKDASASSIETPSCFARAAKRAGYRSVFVKGGCTTFTVIPSAAISLLKCLTKFDSEEFPKPLGNEDGPGVLDDVPPMQTIRPAPLALRKGRLNRQHRIDASVLPITRSITCSSERSSRRPPTFVDALLIKMSKPPKLLTVSFTADSHPSDVKRSAETQTALAPVSWIFEQDASRAPASRAHKATFAPSFAKASAIEKPIPLLPPVIKTDLPDKLRSMTKILLPYRKLLQNILQDITRLNPKMIWRNPGNVNSRVK